MAGKKRSIEEAEISAARRLMPNVKREQFRRHCYKARALPLHVNCDAHTTHHCRGERPVTTAPADSGFLGALALQPSTFTTGSYGWKGSKRLTIELIDSDGGEKEKVQVMLTINATVIGSKQAVREAEVEVEDDAAASDTDSAEEDNVPKPQSTE
ncbi:hypothetical protein H4582DRAFT_2167529 [Lactarius indigo]|nr:hypothetical protein H4582DRAFT_2167529 [Lactarius indigo]